MSIIIINFVLPLGGAPDGGPDLYNDDEYDDNVDVVVIDDKDGVDDIIWCMMIMMAMIIYLGAPCGGPLLFFNDSDDNDNNILW